MGFDTLDMLRSYVARPEPVPVWIDYEAVPHSPALQRRISMDVMLLNSTYLLPSKSRLMFEMRKEHPVFDCITVKVVPYLGPVDDQLITQGMHRGNGRIEVIPDFARGTLLHEIAHVIWGPGHHPEGDRYEKTCVRGRYIGPTGVCPQDIEEMRKRLGI